MMEHSHAYIFLLGIMTIAVCSVATYWLYTVIANLYQDFMHFSRRFRGVE